MARIIATSQGHRARRQRHDIEVRVLLSLLCPLVPRVREPAVIRHVVYRVLRASGDEDGS
jgi:hypothetical protein